MKRIQIISLALLTLIGQHAQAVMSLKVPNWVKDKPWAVSVIGDAPKRYAVIFTKITKDPDAANGKPVVVRTQKDVKPADGGEAYINEELSVPQADITLSAGPMLDGIASIAGMVDPRVGAAAKVGSAILDEALNVVGKELTDKYGLNAFETKLIELLPMEYYEFDKTTNSVKTKPAFLQALQEYTQLLTDYASVVGQYNIASGAYNEERNKSILNTCPPKNTTKRAEYDAQYQKTDALWKKLEPILEKKESIEKKLTNIAIHRVAIMASQDQPGTSCKGGGWEGPWSLYLYYFIGSKQTNIIKIDFCAQKDVKQQFKIRINGNFKDNRGNFTPGGVNLEATDLTNTANNSIKFPVLINGALSDSFETKIYSWFDSMVTDENGGDIATYMFPYELFKLEKKRLKEQADKGDARSKENLDNIETNLAAFKEALGNKGEGGIWDALGIGKGGKKSDEDEDVEEKPKPTSKPSTGGKTPVSGGKTPPTGKGTPATKPSEEGANAYSILGVNTKATDDEIEAAYKKKQATSQYKTDTKQEAIIDDAYNKIKTSAFRKIYDAAQLAKSGADIVEKGAGVVSGVVGAITGGKDKGTTKPSDKGKTPATKAENIGDILKNDEEPETPVTIDKSGKTPSGNTYYEILGVQSDANTDQIDTAYRQKADLIVKAYNASTGENKQKNLEKAKEIQAAYDVLKDVKKRNEYSKIVEDASIL